MFFVSFLRGPVSIYFTTRQAASRLAFNQGAESSILDANDADIGLGLKYSDFLKEFEAIYFRYVAVGE